MSTTPNTRTETEVWLGRLGSRFVNVRCYVNTTHRMPAGMYGGMGWVDERHIDDPDTIETTIAMSLDRLGGQFAVWPAPDKGWYLYQRSPERVRHFPTQEAAEMVAIHRG